MDMSSRGCLAKRAPHGRQVLSMVAGCAGTKVSGEDTGGVWGGLAVAVDTAEEVHGQPYLHNKPAWFLQLLNYNCSEDTFGVTFAVGW